MVSVVSVANPTHGKYVLVTASYIISGPRLILLLIVMGTFIPTILLIRTPAVVMALMADLE